MSASDQQARALLAVAADDLPPGIDLLSGFRARRARRRARGRVTLATTGVTVAAAATVVTLSSAPAPSPRTELASAVSRTAASGYHFSATLAWAPTQPGGTPPAMAGHVTGALDPARRVGEETDDAGGQTRFVGGYVYLYMPHRPIQPGKPWVKAPSQLLWDPATGGGQLRVVAGLASVAEAGPQSLFALLESATTVQRTGGVSGPGWTGTGYAFSVRLAFGASSGGPTVAATGTVDVDQQGRVRDLTMAYRVPASSPAAAGRVSAQMTFSDFGARVPVTAPPASEVSRVANIQSGVSPGPQ